MFQEIISAAEETLVLLFTSLSLVLITGIPLASYFSIARTTDPVSSSYFYQFFYNSVMSMRVIPPLVLVIVFFPLIHFTVESYHSIIGAIFLLACAELPLFVSKVDAILQQKGENLVELGLSIGAKPHTIIRKIIIPEAMSDLVVITQQSIMSLIGSSLYVSLIMDCGIGCVTLKTLTTDFQVETLSLICLILLTFIFFIHQFSSLILHQLEQKS